MLWMKNKIQQCKKANGSSMVEVIIAFLVVMMMLAMFQGGFTLSTKIWKKSIDYIKAEEKFNEDYQKSDLSGTTISSQSKSSKVQLKTNTDTINLKEIELKEYSGEGGIRIYRFE